MEKLLIAIKNKIKSHKQDLSDNLINKGVENCDHPNCQQNVIEWFEFGDKIP